MQDFEKLGAFYLGRVYDAARHQPTNNLLLYDSKDLVTHAVVVGMTGSGKTGLCISLLEEAAIDGVPAILIDPKGDLGNLLLQFPELRGSDFEPWVNTEDAARAGVSVPEFAEQQAKQWQEGLESWGEDGDRIRRLQKSADFSIYTPGSRNGIPLSIMKSFAAPPATLRDDREAFRDKVSNTASAVLALVGVDAEPMKSREHILISTILDRAWCAGTDLDLAGLISAIQHPSFDKIGVLDLESFYPGKERFELAMSLNSLLASPGFEAWTEGEPLDISAMLRTKEGKPRIAIVSIAHLSEQERLFFVSMLLNEMLSWVRTQSGTTSLRALLYMDEIYGYFPPTANPPTKRPLLTLLKQARAFGVGVVLATQNPVDLDYKGLSNAGTWFIGRLQTERDKMRLLEGVKGAWEERGSHLELGKLNELLSSLPKRVFLMSNVHENDPVLFESRWALSYLRGPLNREQIRTLMATRSAATTTEQASDTSAKAAPKKAASSGNGARPVLGPDVPQTFLPVRGDAENVTYYPMMLGSAQIRFTDTKSKTDTSVDKVYLTPIKDDSLPVEWKEATAVDLDVNDLEKTPADGVVFASVPGAASSAKNYVKWAKDFQTWLYGSEVLTVLRSPSTGLCSNPGESEADFRARADTAGREVRDAAIEKIKQKYASKLQTLQNQLLRAQQAEAREKDQVTQQGWSTAVSIGTTILGSLFGSKTLTKGVATSVGSVLKQGSRTYKEQQDVGRAEQTVASVQQQIQALQDQIQGETDALKVKSEAATESLDRVDVKPKKTNIQVQLCTLAWAPYRGDDPAW